MEYHHKGKYYNIKLIYIALLLLLGHSQCIASLFQNLKLYCIRYSFYDVVYFYDLFQFSHDFFMFICILI